jgi:hypothetical protein
MSLLIFLAAAVLDPGLSAQRPTDLLKVDLCAVVASPVEYNQKQLAVAGILSPSYHSLALYSGSCKPKEGYDVTVQAVLPPDWQSWPNGKRLSKILRAHKDASVHLVGKFEGGAERYGPDAARYRFVITEIASVEKNPPDVHP